MKHDERTAAQARAVSMEADGKTREQIAALLNVSNGTITNWLGKKKYNRTSQTGQVESVETPVGEQLDGGTEEPAA